MPQILIEFDAKKKSALYTINMLSEVLRTLVKQENIQQFAMELIPESSLIQSLDLELLDSLMPVDEDV